MMTKNFEPLKIKYKAGAKDPKLSRMTPKVNIEKIKTGDIKLRNSTVRLNRVVKNPFYAKINSRDKKDEKLRMRPAVRLNREDLKLSRMTPKVIIKKLKAGDKDIKLLRQPIVRLNRVAKNPFTQKLNQKIYTKNFPH